MILVTKPMIKLIFLFFKICYLFWSVIAVECVNSLVDFKAYFLVDFSETPYTG